MKILWIPHTGWHIPQRAHLFCHALAERHEVHVTDWVADFLLLKDYFSARYIKNFFYRQYWDGTIRVHGVPRISPAIFSQTLRQINSQLFSLVVKNIIQRHQIDVVVGTFVVPPPEAPALIFDLFDDNVAYWRSFGLNLKIADEIAEIEIAYLQRSDAVVAASSVLVDKATLKNPKGTVHHIPNGVDLSKYIKSRQEIDISQYISRGKLIGVLGNHDKSNELDKVLDIAKILQNENFIFLIAGRGAAIPKAKIRAGNEKISNVIFKGYISMDSAIHLLNYIDVGLCPYQKTAGADSGSPMRLLMYTAAGLPTVCTDLEEVKRMGFPNVVIVKDDAENFVRGIRKAIKLPRSRPDQINNYDIQTLVTKYENVMIDAKQS